MMIITSFFNFLSLLNKNKKIKKDCVGGVWYRFYLNLGLSIKKKKKNLAKLS